MENAIVSIENLSHRYNVQWAVKDISFEIPEKGVYGLLGSNGAGKSTTMNIMCGVLKQTSGIVRIKGVDIKQDPIAAKRYLGFLPQHPPLHMDLTVEEYLTHCSRMRRMPSSEIKRAVGEVMDKCGILHFRQRVLRNLSGGYQQRVGIAQAIVHKPDLVVLDEPTNGLDPNQIVEVRNLIKDIARERTVVLSTHILSEVQATCNYIRMIEQGRVVFAGTMDEFDNYIEPSTFLVSLRSMPSVEELKKVPGIVNAEELGYCKYRLTFSENREIMENFVRTSVANEWRLDEIQLEKSSLDTVFAELSSDKKKK